MRSRKRTSPPAAMTTSPKSSSSFTTHPARYPSLSSGTQTHFFSLNSACSAAARAASALCEGLGAGIAENQRVPVLNEGCVCAYGRKVLNVLGIFVTFRSYTEGLWTAASPEGENRRKSVTIILPAGGERRTTGMARDIRFKRCHSGGHSSGAKQLGSSHSTICAPHVLRQDWRCYGSNEFRMRCTLTLLCDL